MHRTLIDQINDYLQRIHDLHSSERTAMRRAAGCRYGTADGHARMAYMHALPMDTYPSRTRTDAWFLAGCLECLDMPDPRLPLPTALGRLDTQHQTIRPRFAMLLDTPLGPDGALLIQIASLVRLALQAGDCGIDCAGLLRDLLRWQWDTVQTAWPALFVGGGRKKGRNYEGELL